MRTLITQSLLSAWQYAFSCEGEAFDTAYADFMSTLNREKKEPTDAMLSGIRFESLCYGVARGTLPQLPPADVWAQGVNAIANIIRGAAIQVKLQRDITVDGKDYLLYGIADAIKAGVIHDIKFSSTSFNSRDMAGHWLDSPQHPTYMYCAPEASEFQYLSSDGADLYIERYTRNDTPDIAEKIHEFATYLRSEGLTELYCNKWAAL